MSVAVSEACPAEFLALANDLADASGAVIRRYFRMPLAVDDKADESPVTVADREAEEAIRALLSARRPDDGVIGEEHGSERTDAEYVWVVDPIDGTKSFITGRPIFGTLIALTRAGRPLLGIIDQPVIRERWIGALGHGTRFAGGPARTRACPDLRSALLGTTSPDLFPPGRIERFRRVAGSAKHVVYGGDCYTYGQLSSGFVDVVIEAGLKPYDYCALVPVIEEAGGIVTDWNGDPIRVTSDGTVLAAGDRRTHAEALSLLAG